MKQAILIFLILLVVIAGNLLYDSYFRVKTEAESTHEGVLQATDGQEQLRIADGRRTAITDAVRDAEDAVISVNVLKTEVYKEYLSPFDHPFFGNLYIPRRRNVENIGSGVIIDEGGYALTNAHVVEGATQITVTLTDERSFPAAVAGIDNLHDLAVLRIEGEDLPLATIGQSDDLMIGEWVIAVGNPYAFLIKDSRPSVSVGVVSALNRNFTDAKNGKIYKGMIQTDAAINPGNSGGPLMNIFGEVIGINTFIFSSSGGSVGIGFAIPIDRVRKIMDELIQYGRIRERWFGFRVQNLNYRIASFLQLDSVDGVIVSFVEEDGPAEKAGMKRGDIIIAINGETVTNTSEAEMAISDVTIGETVDVLVKRDGEQLTLKLLTLEKTS